MARSGPRSALGHGQGRARAPCRVAAERAQAQRGKGHTAGSRPCAAARRGGGGGGGVGTRPWWLALLACGGAYWPLALEPSAMTRRHPCYCGHPHCRGHPPSWVGIQGGGGHIPSAVNSTKKMELLQLALRSGWWFTVVTSIPRNMTRAQSEREETCDSEKEHRLKRTAKRGAETTPDKSLLPWPSSSGFSCGLVSDRPPVIRDTQRKSPRSACSGPGLVRWKAPRPARIPE